MDYIKNEVYAWAPLRIPFGNYSTAVFLTGTNEVIPDSSGLILILKKPIYLELQKRKQAGSLGDNWKAINEGYAENYQKGTILFIF